MSRALVVGGSREIGRAIAVELAELGHDVELWGRDAERLAALDVAAGDLRVVVWAAGLFDWAPADTADPGTWDALLDVNLTAAAHATPLLLPALLATRGTLVHLGSGASGIRVSLVSPGLVAALAAPVARETPHLLLQPADVAAAVRFVVTFPGAGCPTEVVLSPPVDG